MLDNNNFLPPQTAYRRRLSEMLDLTYELEGLLHIGVTRSALPPRLNQLIVAKLNAIVALADDPATPDELAREDSYAGNPIAEDSSQVPLAEESVLQYAEPEDEHAGEIEGEDEMTGDVETPEAHAEPRNRGRLFSINDRFLYARELFGGKLENFDAAINEIITLDSYDEAEDYLVSEWDIDPESSYGMRFLAVISKLF